MEIYQKRENIADYFTDETKIHEYLHPKKRGRMELLRRAFLPVFEKKINLFLYVIYAFATGFIPVIGAFSIRYFVSVLENLGEKEISTISESLPFLSTVAVYGGILLFLLILTAQIRGMMKGRLMYLRLEEMRKLFYKYTGADLSITEDARVIHSLGNFYGCATNSESGMEGIWNKIFERSGAFVSFFLLSILLGKISVFLPVLALVAIGTAAFGDYFYNQHLEKKIPEIEKNNRIFFNLYAEAQDFSYGKDIRVFRLGEAFLKLGRKLIRTRKRLENELLAKKRIYKFPKSLSFSVFEVSVLYIILKKYEMSTISLAETVMFLSIAVLFSVQMIGISDCIAFVYKELVSLGYFYDAKDAKLSSEGGREMERADFPDLDIRFQDVWFRYPNSEKFVLEGINLEIKEGESLALVGVNGAGKSTLTNLLSGLYMPTKGKILIGGIDTRELSKKTLNKLMAVVFQQFEPLAMTVKENVIAIKEEGEGEEVDERVMESLKKAGVYEKIASFPKGIHSTMLRVLEDDGMVLSGGENQKVSIARALYKKESGILILDEPTSALDALAEEKIYREFQAMIEEKSAIFISHRLASTRFCNRIALLNGGRIEEMGSHEELLKKGGLYKEMFDTQASYYKEEEDGE